jgi:hypothetical protein
MQQNRTWGDEDKAPSEDGVLAWCAVPYVLSCCRPRPVLLVVTPPLSAPLGVLRPKPFWGEAWSPIGFFLITDQRKLL